MLGVLAFLLEFFFPELFLFFLGIFRVCALTLTLFSPFLPICTFINLLMVLCAYTKYYNIFSIFIDIKYKKIIILCQIIVSH